MYSIWTMSSVLSQPEKSVHSSKVPLWVNQPSSLQVLRAVSEEGGTMTTPLLSLSRITIVIIIKEPRLVAIYVLCELCDTLVWLWTVTMIVTSERWEWVLTLTYSDIRLHCELREWRSRCRRGSVFLPPPPPPLRLPSTANHPRWADTLRHHHHQGPREDGHHHQGEHRLRRTPAPCTLASRF